MSFFNRLYFADSGQLDAFGRLRVSNPLTLFSDTSEYGLNSNFWETGLNSGTATYQSNHSSVQLSTNGTTSGFYAIRQSRWYIRYQPGKSQLILMTFVMGAPQTSAVTRIGYFDTNDGIFLQRSGSAVSIILRTYTGGSVDDSNAVAQASWNIDPFDGNGPSKITLDLSKTQILIIDLEWLGVGRVRVGFIVDGNIYYAHEFLNANNNTLVYMRTACLPVRFEVRNISTAGGTLTLDTICASVSSEGSAEEGRAQQLTASNKGTVISLNNGSSGGALLPLISLQAKTTGPNSIPNKGQIILKDILILGTGSNPVYYEIRLNATLTGAVFTSIGATSIANYDITASAVSGGTVLQSGYIPSTAGTKSIDDIILFRDFPLVYTALGAIQDTLTICAYGLGNSSSAACSLNWQELY